MTVKKSPAELSSALVNQRNDGPLIRYSGRFAPSPTGPLHFGSLITAVARYCDARAHQGRWLVRVEDTDITRIYPGSED
ncbi:glutamate--tRNA ligase family protein, partial [Acinetobacter baumannii]|uniref:glutamate--tRNA ligase family protein n=1 Tax=Acinetobacter baumannii TaxID=470 RepID=UPI003AF669E7